MPAFLPPLVFHPNVSQMNFSIFILKDGKVEYTESLQITATIFDGGQNVSNSITIFIHSTDCKLKVIRDCEGKKQQIGGQVAMIILCMQSLMLSRLLCSCAAAFHYEGV